MQIPSKFITILRRYLFLVPTLIYILLLTFPFGTVVHAGEASGLKYLIEDSGQDEFKLASSESFSSLKDIEIQVQSQQNIVGSFDPGSLSINNLPPELQDLMTRKALEYSVPPALVKAIAMVESAGRHYDLAGEVIRGGSGEIGIMQVYPDPDIFSQEELEKLYELEYNITAGIQILLEKKMYTGLTHPVFHDENDFLIMDDNILETWYFAIWAYNGWLARNNPAVVGAGNTYQDKVIAYIAQEGYKLKPPPKESFREDLPRAGEVFALPASNDAGLIPLLPGSRAEVFVDNLNIRVLPATVSGTNREPVDIVGVLNRGQQVYLLSGLQTSTRGRWYQVSLDGEKPLGWVAGIFKTSGSKLVFENYLNSLETFNGHQWDVSGIVPVPSDKVWRVRFSNPLKQESLTYRNVYILNQEKKLVPITLTLEEEGKVMAITPANNYASGEEYTLYLRETLMSNKGDYLAQPYRMNFTIKDSTLH